MNPISHAYLVLRLFKDKKLSKDERDFLIVGSILPDINQSGLIHCHKTHYNSVEFFRFVKNPLHKYLALGMILHGEEPKGLDYYSHYETGIIEQNRLEINQIAKKYQRAIGKINGMTAHYITEFSIDAIVCQKDKTLISQILTALKNPKLKDGITAFSTHFGLSEKKNYKIISLLKNKHLLNFFRNFSSTETVTKSWINFTFFLNLKKEGRNLPFREKIKKFTEFSYYTIKRKMHHRQVSEMFQEINRYLENPAMKFFDQTITKLKPLQEKLSHEIA